MSGRNVIGIGGSRMCFPTGPNCLSTGDFLPIKILIAEAPLAPGP